MEPNSKFCKLEARTKNISDLAKEPDVMLEAQVEHVMAKVDKGNHKYLKEIGQK